MKVHVPAHDEFTCDACGRECAPPGIVRGPEGEALKPTFCHRTTLLFREHVDNVALHELHFCDRCMTEILVAINAQSLLIRERLGEPLQIDR